MDELKNQMIRWNEVRYFRNKSPSFQIYFQQGRLLSDSFRCAEKLEYMAWNWASISYCELKFPWPGWTIFCLNEMWLGMTITSHITILCDIITTSWKILKFLCVFVLIIGLINIAANIWIWYWTSYEKINQMPPNDKHITISHYS